MSNEEQEIVSEAKLIDLVRERRLIYDKRVDAYRSRNLRQRAWEEIGVAFEKSASQCLKAWTSLRAQYMAHRRKLKTPSGTAAGTRPYFRHEHAMQFVSEAAGEESTFSNVPDEDENNEESPPEVDTPNSRDQSESDTPVLPKMKSDTRVHQKYGQKRKLDQFDEELLNYIKVDGPTQDEFKSIGDLVTCKLRKISGADKKLSSQLQLKITNLLLEAEIDLE